MKNLLLILTLVFSHTILWSQSDGNWKKLVKTADELFVKSLYADAAEKYEAAWREKPKKLELIDKAAECYYIIKDYKKGITAYQNIKDEHKEFPLAGLRYARCLKQDGNFDEASREFVYFLNNYKGSDKSVVTEVVQNEIRGCELGIQLYSQPPNDNISVTHLGSNINSPETEFAPIPFNDEVLYFSSTVSNKAKIYFSMKEKSGDWKKASLPKNFPDLPDKHYCNGTLSPDSKRFYFTICESVESWGGLTTRCEINVIKKIGDTWTTPQRLRDYINTLGSTTTHPYVVHQDGREILYFSSNREGSIGGMDLWYAERAIDSEDIDFTFPVNLGPRINTLGDEITPVYNVEENTLYFSSNGHVSIGGQDIFKSSGKQSNWTAPENIGLPFNSPADDFFFVKTPSGKGGYFVSNRIFGMEKITSTHEDIFGFSYEKSPALVSGNAPGKTETTETDTPELPVSKPPVKAPVEPPVANTAPLKTTPEVREIPAPKAIEIKLTGGVYDKNTDEIISNVTVFLYEVLENGTRRLLTNNNSVNGSYEFKLLPNRTFVVEAQKEGYNHGIYQFSTSDQGSMEEDIFMQKFIPEPAKEEVVTAIPKPTPTPANINTSPKTKEAPKTETKSSPSPTTDFGQKIEEISESISDEENVEMVESDESLLPPPDFESYENSEYIARGQSRFDRVEFRTKSPRHTGDYYKVQIIALDKFNPNESRFQSVSNLGRLDAEYLLKKGLTRVLIADFYSLEDAKEVLRQAKSMGFGRAFIVKYTDGQRWGMIYR